MLLHVKVYPLTFTLTQLNELMNLFKVFRYPSKRDESDRIIVPFARGYNLRGNLTENSLILVEKILFFFNPFMS